jgi:hypothetical protein
MSHQGARLAVLGVALLLIAGCGGGSNAGSNSGGSGGGTGGSGGGNGGGNGSGSGDQATTVTFGFTGYTPTLVAVKVGSGNYTAQNLSSGKLTISIPSGTTTYSVAYLCPLVQNDNGTTNQTEFIQFESVQDGTTLNALNGQCFGPVNGTASTGNLTGTVDASAFPTAASMAVTASSPDGLQYTPLLPVGSFQLSATTGSDRVLVGLYDSSSYPNLLAIKNFDSQIVPGTLNGGNTVTFSSSDATTSQPLTFVNLPTSNVTPFTDVRAIGDSIPLTSGLITQYQQLPAGILQSGDYYTFSSSTGTYSDLTGIDDTVGSVLYRTSGGPVTFSFPAPWTTATAPVPASLPTFTFGYTGYVGQSGVSDEGGCSWSPTNNLGNEINVIATQNYLGNATTLTVPDLSAVSGFLAPPGSGTSVSWLEGVSQGTFPSTSTLAGGTETFVEASGNFTVP